MQIERISIENFRQFVGKQEILFPNTSDRNVTLIIGENGSGKTTLCQAFLWCLYGEIPGFKKKEDLLSKTRQNEPYSKMEISIEMFHDGESFTMTRTHAYQYTRLTTSRATLSYTENGETKIESNEKATEHIKRILPQELSSFFFLSGEKIDSMSDEIKAGKAKSFSIAVSNLLGLEYYKKAISHLKSIRKNYDLKEIPNDSTVNSIQEKLRTIHEKINDINSEIESKKRSRADYNEKISDLKAKLKGISSSKQIQEEIEKLDKQIKENKDKQNREITQAIENFAGSNNSMGKAPYYFAQSIFEHITKTLDEILTIPQQDVPEKLHADLIDWIESHHRCICGEEIHDGCPKYENLERYRKIVPPESISTLVKQEEQRILGSFRLGQDLFKTFTYASQNLTELSERSENLNEEIDRLQEELRNSSDTSKIQEKLEFYQKKDGEIQDNIDELTENKIKQETTEKKYQEDYDSALQKSKEGIFIKKCKDASQALLKDFEQKLQASEDKKRKQLTIAVKKAFQEIYGNAFSIEIDEKYGITTSNDLEKSTGQGMCVIFAFLAGLLDVIKSSRNTESTTRLESYPLIFDAPFSALDEARISSVCSVLPKVSSQIIIFIKDTDGNIAKKELCDKIGKSYLLQKKNEQDNYTEIKSE